MLNKQLMVTGLKGLVEVGKKKAPFILIGASIVGFATTAVMAFKAAPKVNIVLQDAEEDKGEELKPIEKAVIVGKTMWPTLLVGLLSAVCALGSCYILNGRLNAMSVALAASEKALTDYQCELIKDVGPEKTKEITEKFKKSHDINTNPPTEENTVPAKNPEGKVRVFDKPNGRYIWTTYSDILNAEKETNLMYNRGETVTVNDFFDYLDVDRTETGNYFIYEQSVTDAFEVIVTSQVLKDGSTCLVIDYDLYPEPASSAFNK